MRCLMLFICMLFIQVKGTSQNRIEIELKVQNFKTQQGLPSNNINFTFQDKFGFIWIGTQNGLSKFDGYYFKNFNPNPKINNSIVKIGNYLTYCKISDSIYYLTTKRDGVIKLNILTNILSKVKNLPENTLKILLDKNNNFWIITDKYKLFSVLISSANFTEHFIPFRENRFVNSVILTCIVADFKNDSVLWIGSNIGLIKYNLISKKLHQYTENSNEELDFEVKNYIQTLCFDVQGNLWAGKRFGGISKWNNTNRSWEKFLFYDESKIPKVDKNNSVYSIKLINQSSFSLCTETGLFFFNFKSKIFVKYKLTHNNEEIKYAIFNVFSDKDSNLWISHDYQNGLSYLSKKFNALKSIKIPTQRHLPDKFNSYITSSYYSKFHQKYFFTLSNHDGLLVYSKNMELLNQIFIDSKNGYEPITISVGEDNEHLIWINSNIGKLFRYNPENQELIELKDLPFNKCFYITNNKNKNLLVETEKGLFEYENKQWKQLIFNSEIKFISNVFESKFYYLLQNKIFVFDLNTKKSSQLCNVPANLIDNKTYANNLFIDSKNRIWLTAEVGGLYCYLQSNKQWQHYSFIDGLLSSSTFIVAEDKLQRIFVNTYEGLYYFNEAQNRFVDFDNLLSKKPNGWFEGLLFINPNDQLIVTKLNEFFIIDKNVVITTNKERVIITEIYGSNYAIYYPKNGVKIPNYQNDINFSFSNFDFANSDEIILEYQLLGSKNWIQLNKGLNKLSFASLPAGSYNINYRILGNPKYNTFTFKINEIWYKSNWFYFCLSLIFIGFILYYFNKNNKQKQLEKRVSELKLISLQSQLNPHFLFNCLTSISGLIKTKEYDKSEIILNDFAKLMRSILLNSSKDLIALEEEIKISKLYLDIEQMRKDNTFDYTFEIDKNTMGTFLLPPLMLQPFLENAVKHGLKSKTHENKGHLLIKIVQLNKELQITIKDNGDGKLADQNSISLNHQSMGIEIQRERFNQYQFSHNILINLASDLDNKTGAEVKITIKN